MENKLIPVEGKDPIKATIQGYSNSAEIYKSMRSDLSFGEKSREYFLDNLKGKKILDVGCAHGRDLGEFHRKGMEVTGIDLTPEFISLVKKDYPGSDVQIMDMRNLEFSPETFDGLRSSASLLHIPKNEVRKTLEGFHRVLKKGGLLFIKVIEGTDEGFDDRDRFFAYRQPEELIQELKESKFSIQKSNIYKPEKSKHARINIFATAE